MSELTEGPEKPNVAPVDRVSRLWTGLTERKLAQWTVGYIALAYGIQHGVILTAESFEWPSAVARISMLLLVLSLPLVVTLAWYHGERASRHFSHAELTIVSLLLVGLAMLFYVFVKPAEEGGATTAIREAGVTAARSAAADPHSAISVAVLPFANMSGDASQEFFSDGMTEEITAALAKIPDLRVVARTSAFQFKSTNRDIQQIGQQLHATHFIEGSVRKAGNRVRITAQLIKSDDGTHIWAENYDREITDVFAIQEDIARAITASLNMSLGLKPGTNLISNRSIDPGSYEAFLRGKVELRKGRAAYAEQIAILEPLVQRNPDYAPGWAALAQAYNYAVQFYSITASQSAAPAELLRLRDSFIPKRDGAIRRGVELDPGSIEGLIIQAVTQTGPRRWALQEDLIRRALALDPNHPLALSVMSQVFLGPGRLKEGLAIRQQMHALDPFVPLDEGNLAEALWLDGQDDAAIAVLRENLGRPGAGSGTDLPRILASLGRYEEAADMLSRYPTPINREISPAAAALLRGVAAKKSAPGPLPRLGNLGYIYLHVGAPERALEYYEQDARGAFDIALLWHKSYAPVRKTERFKKIVRDAGYVEYWRERGWPKFCHPTSGDDFACD